MNIRQLVQADPEVGNVFSVKIFLVSLVRSSLWLVCGKFGVMQGSSVDIVQRRFLWVLLASMTLESNG
jgi:hypothetical protein